MRFQVIAGSGHCGTMWLSQVLNNVPGQIWIHEGRSTATALPWVTADEYEPSAKIFDSYWEQVRQMSNEWDVFGDSNSWPPEALPAVNKIVPIERVIYLTRDKEKQAYSLLHKSPVWSNPPYPAVANERLKMYSRISGLPQDVDLLVQANDFMPEWLRSKGLAVDVYSLEELTTDYYKFRELTGMTDGQFEIWRNIKINQKVFA